MTRGALEPPTAGRGAGILLGIFGLQLIFGIAGAAVWLAGRLADPAVLPELTQVADPGAGPATLESALPVAHSRARLWNERAELVAVSAQFDWPLEVPPDPPTAVPAGGWLTYVFSVPNPDRAEGDLPTFTVRIERHRASVVDERVVEPGIRQPASPPLLNTYPTNSSQALLLAEQHGGTVFRRGCPPERSLSRISLDTTDPLKHRWTITYLDARSPDQNALLVRVDAQTGEVTEARWQVPPDAETCEEPPAP